MVLPLRTIFCLAVAMGSLSVAAQSSSSSSKWVTTWITANAAAEGPAASSNRSFSNQTLREVVHTTVGGRALRLRLSNTFGPGAIRFDAVYIGLQKEDATLVPASNHQVTFGGSPSIAIPEGAEVLSDPVSFAVGPQQNLVISLFTAGETGPATRHDSAFQTNYVSGAGNFAPDEGGGAFVKTAGSWYFLSAVEAEVLAPANLKGSSSMHGAGAVVALGDSITDGASSRPDKNERWTDVLAQRLLAKHTEIAVLNAGIGGNRVLTSSPCFGQNAVARLRRDVLSQVGIKAVILFEGINDIGQPDTPIAATNPCLSRTQVTAEEIIVGYKQIIVRTRAAGLKIFCGTILPYQGSAGWTVTGEAKRVAVNQWIRTSGAFDGVIDFDAALRDPAAPTRMAPQYDSGDHLHPGPAGQAAMGNAVHLDLLR
jgi:lysophospholipase L1-like esterase